MIKPVQIILLLLLPWIFVSLFGINNAYLGVFLEDLTELEKREMKLENGVRIDLVIADSPADESGLQANDIIIRINDMPITSQDQVRTIIENSEPGDVIKIEVFTGGTRKNMELTLGDLSKADTSRIKILDTKTKNIGVKLQHLTDQLKEYFGIKNGVLIAEIIPGSPAEKAGLRAGDVITHIEQKPINHVRDLKEIIKSKQIGEVILVEYVRDGERKQTKVEIAESDEFFSYDMNNEIIFLGRREIDLSEINRWFDSVFSDTTRKELEKRIEELQEELNQIRRKLLNQQ